MDRDNDVGIDCGSGVGRAEKGKGGKWVNYNKINKNFRKGKKKKNESIIYSLTKQSISTRKIYREVLPNI